MRDSQQSKVYEAEKKLRWEFVETPMTPEETQKYVDKVCKSKFFLSYRAVGDEDRRFSRQSKFIEVRLPNRKYGWAYAGHSYVILPIWARVPTVILHELSHHVVKGSGFASHGPEFVRTYYDMLGHYLPPQIARRYKELCKEHRVKMARRVLTTISTPEEQVMNVAAERQVVGVVIK